MYIPTIEDLITYFKFGYEGPTSDLLYLAICLFAFAKVSIYIWKLIKKKGVFSND